MQTMNYKLVLKNKYNTKYPMISAYHIYEHIIIWQLRKFLYDNNIFIFEIYGITKPSYIEINIEIENNVYFMIKRFLWKLRKNLFDFSLFYEVAIKEIEEEIKFIFLANNIGYDLTSRVLEYLHRNSKTYYMFNILCDSIEISINNSNSIHEIINKNKFKHHKVVEDQLRTIREDVLINNNYMTGNNFFISKFDNSKFRYLLFYFVFDIEKGTDLDELYRIKLLIDNYMEGEIIDSKVSIIDDCMCDLFFLISTNFIERFNYCIKRYAINNKVKLNYRGVL